MRKKNGKIATLGLPRVSVKPDGMAGDILPGGRHWLPKQSGAKVSAEPSAFRYRHKLIEKGGAATAAPFPYHANLPSSATSILFNQFISLSIPFHGPQGQVLQAEIDNTWT